MRITLFLLLKIKECNAFKCENNQVSSNKWPLLQNEDWRPYNVLSLLSWQRSCTMRWGSIKGTWKSWQLASWLNLKCKKKLFQMMPKWPSFSWEVENYWKRWKFFQNVFYFSLDFFVKKIQQAYHKLTHSFIWPALTFTAKKSLKQKTFIPSGNNAHLFFPCSFPEH